MKIQQLTLLFFLLTLVSCNRTVHDDSGFLPGVKIPPGNYNTTIRLNDAPEFLNSHKNGEVLLLQIINLSNTTIAFPSDYGFKLFTNRDGKWVDVPNNTFYAGSTLYLPTKSAWPSGLTANIMPYMAGLKSSVSVRVIVIGHKKDSNEEVGAYLDITINP